MRKRMKKLKQAIDECKDDTWECPKCGHSEPWWTNSNAHYSSEYPTPPTKENCGHGFSPQE